MVRCCTARNGTQETRQEHGHTSHCRCLEKGRESRSLNQVFTQRWRKGNSDQSRDPEQADHLSSAACRNHIADQGQIGDVEGRIADSLHEAKDEEPEISSWVEKANPIDASTHSADPSTKNRLRPNRSAKAPASGWAAIAVRL